jgi:hypothetical protein
MATKVLSGGVILEPERPGSRPTSALRINGDRSLQASMSRMPKFEIDMSEYGAKTGPIGPKVVHLHDLGVLKTTSWKMPGPSPAGLLLTLDDVGTSCDMAIAKTIYEAAVRGDAAVVAEACARLAPPPAEGEEAPPKLFPKIEDVYGLQPLSLAAGSGHVEAVVALLDAGADVNAVQPVGRGEAALHRAARSGHAAVITTLLERGAAPNIASADGAPLPPPPNEASAPALAGASSWSYWGGAKLGPVSIRCEGCAYAPPNAGVSATAGGSA